MKSLERPIASTASTRTWSRLERLWRTIMGEVEEVQQFNLSHVFSSEVVRIVEEESELKVAELFKQLEELMAHQLKVFTQESLGPSLHPTYAAFIHRESWQQGQVDIFDTRYQQKQGMLAMSRNALDTATTQAERHRYVLETYQIEHGIYPKIQSILQNSDTFRSSTEAELVWVQQALPQASRAYFLGDRHMYFLPKNPIYPGDLAFVNFCQVVYTPTDAEKELDSRLLLKLIRQGQYQGQLNLLVEPVFANLSNEELIQTHQHLHDPDEKLQHETEEALMSQLWRIPEWRNMGVGREEVLKVFSQIFQDPNHSIMKTLQQGQQTVRQVMQEQKENIEQGAKFLACVLTQELTTFSTLTSQEQQRLAQGLPKKLHLAFGLVASPIMQKQRLSFYAIQAAYNAIYPNGPLGILPMENSIVFSPTAADPVKSKHWLKNSRRIHLATSDQKAIMSGLQLLPRSYSKRIIADTACNLMSFGGYAERLAQLQGNQAMAFMQGQAAMNKQELSQFVSDAEDWKMGKCVSPDCKYKGRQLVGPCSICLGCQLRFEQEEMGLLQQDVAKPELWPEFSQTTKQAVKHWKQSFEVNDLLPSFLSPDLTATVSRPNTGLLSPNLMIANKTPTQYSANYR